MNQKMSREEKSPQIPTRRSTRSTVLASCTATDPETTTHTLPPLTLNDLFSSSPEQKPTLTLDSLLSRFQGRRSQIQDLLRLLGPANSPTLPLFLYGPPSTGKTTILLQTLNHLNRPVVYSSCRSHYSPRVLFESVLNQLSLHRRDSSNNYASAKRCDKPSDFANLLRDALINVSDNLSGGMVCLVFDNFEMVCGWDKSGVLLPFLFNLYDILKMPDKVGIVFVSNASLDTYYCSNAGYVEPIPVYFPEYSEEDLRRILMRNHQENQKLYSSFLDIVLRPFCRVTRRVDELSTIFSSLFRKYCEPLSGMGVVPNEEMKRKLFSHFQPHIAPALNETFRVQSCPLLDDESSEKTRSKGIGKKSAGGEDSFEVDFHMSTSAKYLLISAFLASRNPATLDASLFDSTGGLDNRKRKRKASEKSMEQKEIAEQESLMKGPGTFPLERLLAIFQCITSVAESSLEEEEHGNDALRTEGGDNGLMCDVLLQLSSLCNANFIIKGGSCPLEGATRYRSTVSEDLALKVARSLKFPLPNFLYRR